MPHTIRYLISIIVVGLLVGGLYLWQLANSAPPTLPFLNNQWKLVFSDEFDGNNLDTDKWSTCYHWYDTVYGGCTNSGNNELEWYTPGQVTISNGVARLTAERKTVDGKVKNEVQSFPYVSGMLATGGSLWNHPAKWSSQYGYFEARVKLPSGKGLWPAFWLLPEDNSWPPEIDVFEVLGDKPDTIHMNYHWLGDGVHKQDAYSFSDPNLASGWHTYAVEWRAGRITWYIDNVARKTYSSTTVTDKPMYLILNLAVGGDWPGAPNASTVFPASMDIDYVHAYKLRL